MVDRLLQKILVKDIIIFGIWKSIAASSFELLENE